MNSLLVITDDPDQKRRLSSFFSLDGYSVSIAETLSEANELIAKFVFDVAVVDLDDSSPVEAFRKFIRLNSDVMTILVYDEEQTALSISLVNHGGFESIKKPYKLGSLYNKVEKAVRFKILQLEAQNLRGDRDLIHWSGDLVGHSPTFQEVLRQVHKVARSDSSVVLLGESGTGKEVVGGILHYNSLRNANAFVRVNCAALHEDLLETELFGHEKGAFTGAVDSRQGRFEHANGGTIFLDEIADMSLRTQAKVLRVLQEKEFERVGSNRTTKVDVRVISATNKSLEEEIAAGRFREDLFYRLNVVTIRLPPLRERKADIMPLARHFLTRFAANLNRDILDFDHEAEEVLTSHSWPGNIRELKNSIERAVLFAENKFLTVEDLGLRNTASSSRAKRGDPAAGYDLRLPDRGLDLENVERGLILQALEKTDWIQKKAARLLGVTPRVLNYKIKRFSITHENWIVNS